MKIITKKLGPDGKIMTGHDHEITIKNGKGFTRFNKERIINYDQIVKASGKFYKVSYIENGTDSNSLRLKEYDQCFYIKLNGFQNQKFLWMNNNHGLQDARVLGIISLIVSIISIL